MLIIVEISHVGTGANWSRYFGIVDRIERSLWRCDTSYIGLEVAKFTAVKPADPDSSTGVQKGSQVAIWEALKVGTVSFCRQISCYCLKRKQTCSPTENLFFIFEVVRTGMLTNEVKAI